MAAGFPYGEDVGDSDINQQGIYEEIVDMEEKDAIDDKEDQIDVNGIDAEDFPIEDDNELEEEDENDEDEMEVVPPSSGAPLQLPPADNFDEMAKRLMKPVPDYPVKEETYNVWHISDWSGLRDEKVRGPKFECGGFEWNVLLFPRGSNSNQLSIYIEPHPIKLDENEDQLESPDVKKWYVCAKFGLDLWNPEDPTAHYSSGSFHRFNEQEADWGFSSLIDLRQLRTPLKSQKRPILEQNQMNITAYIRVIDDSSTGVLWSSFADYDSKKATGFVGLNNQGATCYLNSLLQSYYTTKIFRKLVYQIPVDVNKISVPLSLQKIFYLLLTSCEPVGTLELTKSFGWDSSDAFTQHDVQELNRVLMDKLETAMKSTPIEGALNDIFVGKMKSFIKCVDVPYESSRVEDFWDIQLNVKGFKNLQESFQNYIEIEMLNGENKYQAGEEYGYQDAKKGVVFQSFPPVLHLQLKRFEYDFMVDDLVKIDDRYEFPDMIDLKPFLEEDLPDDVKKQNWKYKLHGVLVHQGSISNGHYYAMIKPKAYEDTWLRFDDDKVWKVTPYQVFHENFGANVLSPEMFARLSRVDQNENLIRRATSAYMLVYYRESELATILPDNDDEINKVIPKNIPEKIKFEREEIDRKEKARQEALYYSSVKFVTEENFASFDGFDLYPDPTISRYYDESVYSKEAFPMIKKYRKDSPFIDLFLDIGKQLGYFQTDLMTETIDDKFIEELPFRLVTVNHRNNHTNRPDVAPNTSIIKNSLVGAVYMKCFNRKHDEMCFYVEEKNKDLKNIASLLPESENLDLKKFSFDDVEKRLQTVAKTVDYSSLKPFDMEESSPYIIIFLKYFDPFTNQVKGLTHVTVMKDEIISPLVPFLNKLLGFSPSTELEFFEELSPFKIDSINPKLTFEKLELNNGDILCVQALQSSEALAECDFQTAKEYYNFLFTRLHIHVSPFKAEDEAEDSDFVADRSGSSPEKDKRSECGKSFNLWVSTQDDYEKIAKQIAKHLGPQVDPKYLRLFIRNYQGVRYPLRSTNSLSQFFPKLVAVSQMTNFEYEVLNISIKEYENMKSIKIFWLTNIMHYHIFDILVPRLGTVEDLLKKLISKVHLDEEKYRGILVWAGNENKYSELIRFDRTLESISDSCQLYAGYFPVEVEILVNYDMIKSFDGKLIDIDEIPDEDVRNEIILSRKNVKRLNIIPAFHFHKNSSYQHGIPFVFPVYPDESFARTKERLRIRLGLGQQALDKIRFALTESNGKGRYLESEKDDLVLYDEIGNFEDSVSLALDHPDRTPRKVSQFDKGISIK